MTAIDAIRKELEAKGWELVEDGLWSLNLGDSTAYSPTNKQSPASYWETVGVTLSAN